MSGAFHVDDQAQLFELVLDAPGSLTVTSIGYAGGLDVDGQAVAAGGFDTMLFLYSSDGTLLAQSDDGVDTPIDPSRASMATRRSRP